MKNIIGKTNTLLFNGFETTNITIEAKILPGLSSFCIVGMPDKCILEAKERVRGAFHSSGIAFPGGKILVNLSPASVYKDGTHYDLPIALSILNAMGEIPDLVNHICIGELSLCGKVVATYGGLITSKHAISNNLCLITGKEYENDILLSPQFPKLLIGDSLLEIIHNINQEKYASLTPLAYTKELTDKPFTNIIGQLSARRALMICAAGQHHMSIVGAPGIGKSTIANEIPKLLPDLTENQSIEVTSIFSMAGLLQNNKLITRPAFRTPHSTSSYVSLIGGSMPGEVSLSYNGVLFLDELPEFNCIDALRIPLEERKICISRARQKFVYPCNFLMIAAMNPCKCGFILEGRCTCRRFDYMSRVSAPIMDRIDVKLYLAKPRITNEKDEGEYKGIIEKARANQLNRYEELNSIAPINKIETTIHSECDNILQSFIKTRNPSIRTIHKVKRIARTIADLRESNLVFAQDMCESISFIN